MITTQTMKEFLEKYDYNPTETGLKAILNTWETNKADLLEHFRKHPNWDEDNLAIVFKDDEYERGFEKSALNNFFSWVDNTIDDIIIKNGIRTEKIRNDIAYYSNMADYMASAYKCYRKISNENKENLIVCENIVDVKDRVRQLRKKYNEILESNKEIYITSGEKIAVPFELATKIKSVQKAFEYIEYNCRTQFITKEQANDLKEIYDVKINEGLKLTKAIQKYCKELDIDKIQNWKHRNGIEENEMKDYGYNYHFALLADRINPIKYKRITVISLNPLDYWGMSFGYKWASCHTIDKKNKRNVPNHNYEGCYSAGTESYMLDSSSVIYYVINEDYNGNLYWSQDKMNRVVFSMNEKKDVILESRVYPDGRDGGDDSLSAQFRAVMQKVISDLYDLNNYWTIKKGSDYCSDYTKTTGVHYPDYIKYDDVNVSLNKDSTNMHLPIKIGHYPICPCCGREHGLEDNIVCEDCQDEGYRKLRCENCDDEFEEDDDNSVIFTLNGTRHYFDCWECAENAGYQFCYDDDEWHDADDLEYCENDNEYHLRDNCYEDSRTGYWYYGDPEIETDDGNTYYSEDNAEADGYNRDYFTDDWMLDLEWDEYENEYFDPDNSEAIETEDGHFFATEASAENAGYVKTVNDEWHPEEDCRYDDYNELWFTEDDAEVICEDGEFFYSRNSAVEAGYMEVNDKWVLESEETA